MGDIRHFKDDAADRRDPATVKLGDAPNHIDFRFDFGH